MTTATITREQWTAAANPTVDAWARAYIADLNTTPTTPIAQEADTMTITTTPIDLTDTRPFTISPAAVAAILTELDGGGTVVFEVDTRGTVNWDDDAGVLTTNPRAAIALGITLDIAGGYLVAGPGATAGAMVDDDTLAGDEWNSALVDAINTAVESALAAAHPGLVAESGDADGFLVYAITRGSHAHYAGLGCDAYGEAMAAEEAAEEAHCAALEAAGTVRFPGDADAAALAAHLEDDEAAAIALHTTVLKKARYAQPAVPTESWKEQVSRARAYFDLGPARVGGPATRTESK